METSVTDTRIPFSRWIPYLFVAVVIGTVSAIFVPYLNHQREMARKQSSRNNLRIIGLAVHNYNDSYGSLPIGATVAPDGTGHHGWMTRLLPQIESSPLYWLIDFDHAWDDPANEYVFRVNYSPFQSPSVGELATTQGLVLTHYTGNPKIFHRNESVTFSDMTAGTDGMWMVAEAAGAYRPWGDPFNWRSIDGPLNSGPDSVGRPTGDGAFILFADGSARFHVNAVDPVLLRRWAYAGPHPKPEQTLVPPFEAELTDDVWQHRTISGVVDKDGSWIEVQDSESRVAHTAICFGDGPSPHDLRALVERCPTLNEVHGKRLALDDEKAAILSELSELRVLSCASLDLGDEGIASIARMRSLVHVDGHGTTRTREALIEALPDATVRVGHQRR